MVDGRLGDTVVPLVLLRSDRCEKVQEVDSRWPPSSVEQLQQKAYISALAAEVDASDVSDAWNPGILESD